MAKRSPGQLIRVLIVEDSRSQRELLVRLLEASGKFEVVGAVDNGQEGVHAAQRLRPDVVAMDIHLPILDGYEATRQIMQCCATPIVMVSSSLGDAGRRSMEALSAGAMAVVRKPGNLTRAEFEQDRTNLLRTLELMADVPVVTRHPSRFVRQSITPPEKIPSVNQMKLVAIAASTGGPAAVQAVLRGLGGEFPLPILLVQHIALGFVEALADWLNATLPLRVCIAKHEEIAQPKTVYLAPDSYHLMLLQCGVIGLRAARSGELYCPSANVLFDSVAQTCGKRALGVIMTGMGDDGAKGLLALRQSGGQTLAQDEASCVVYGMPQSAVAVGAVMQTVSLTNIPKAILERVAGDTLL